MGPVLCYRGLKPEPLSFFEITGVLPTHTSVLCSVTGTLLLVIVLVGVVLAGRVARQITPVTTGDRLNSGG